MNRDEIIECLGVSNWNDVVMYFGGSALHLIQAGIDEMFPNDDPLDNEELAESIYREVVTGVNYASLESS